ncbi:MAG TPA: class I SAM-dependent methyltransferase [Campylobacterales bacterium]|nr:class I SAM-dependent methyltransferase [Campylobacterales bacterium]HIP41819.1 class I SAM-dependent methyltransferase [Campylobacterales bacterium]
MKECKICYDKTKTIRDKKKSFIYYRCLSCGFVYLDDTQMVDSVNEKKQYELHNNSFESLGYVKMFEDFIEEAIAPYKQNIKTALDFGCGPGPVLAELLRRKGVEVDQYDLYFSPKKVYEGKKYDLITSTEVFEHLQKPIEVLEILVKHINDNGYIILMTKFPPKDDITFLNWWYRRDVTHISFFTPKSFEIMAEKVGLKMIKTINDNIVVLQKVC